MDREGALIESLRSVATNPAARGLRDDAAVWREGEAWMVVTHDAMVEGVHWLPEADPADVAWKLVATNLSDLAAKGASPIGVLLGFTLGVDPAWDARFVGGLRAACGHYAAPLLGGDTTALPHPASARALGLTALGRASVEPPSRSGLRPGDGLWVVGSVGDAGAGLALLRAGQSTGPLVAAHRRPVARLAAGAALAPFATAMMDISDGLLIDAARMARASGVAVRLDLDRLPMSDAFTIERGSDLAAALFAATAGDDYALLVSLPQGVAPPVDAVCVGEAIQGDDALRWQGNDVPWPERDGWRHVAPRGDGAADESGCDLANPRYAPPG